MQKNHNAKGSKLMAKKKRKKITKPCTYLDIEQACNSLYVSTSDLMTILGGVSKGKADEFRMKLEEKLDNEKIQALAEEDETKRNKMLAHCFYYKDTKPHKLPIRRVLEEAHVDLDYVRRKANKMRKAINIEKKGELENETKAVS